MEKSRDPSPLPNNTEKKPLYQQDISKMFGGGSKQEVDSSLLGDGVFSKDEVVINSWNINGVRAVFKKEKFTPFFKDAKFDILCFNETKIDAELVEKLGIKSQFPEEFYHYWNCCKIKKGYSGTAILSKVKPISVKYGLGKSKHDGEGRAITLEFDKFYLVATYVPNAMRGLKRLGYRTKEWDSDFRDHINALKLKKPTIWAGDLNVAHKEIDIHNPKSAKKSPGFTPQERDSFTETLESGWLDTFRHLYPETVAYSWWNVRSGARQKGLGWRLDYFVINQEMLPALVDSEIQKDVMGSDHCPVELSIDLSKL